jgi:hypothetical protein
MPCMKHGLSLGRSHVAVVGCTDGEAVLRSVVTLSADNLELEAMVKRK